MEDIEESTNNFCPFIKADCKNDKCVMWKEDSCLIVNYLISVQCSSESELEEDTEFDEYKKIPEELELESVDYLVDKFILFLESTVPGNQRIWVPHHAKRFWKSVGVYGTWAMPSDIQNKMGQVETKTQVILDAKRQIKLNK